MTYWIAVRNKGGKSVTGFVGASQRSVKHQITRSGESVEDYRLVEVVPSDDAVARDHLQQALERVNDLVFR